VECAGNRRHRYPFTNCTQCGPRFSIIEALPCDRENTTMRGFTMCPARRREYEDPHGVIDWAPAVLTILRDMEHSLPVAEISANFHHALVEAIIAVARRTGERCVALSGGCFQNKYLTERAIRRLREEGFCPFWHRHVPPNDGGIALGQIAGAARTQLETNLP
jgi:hydrogenase maturation factor HypF (carbamoyltransferase family)